MKQVSEMPTSGQFVAVFQRDKSVESRSYELNEIDNSVIYDIDERGGKWLHEADMIKSFLSNNNAQYFIAD